MARHIAQRQETAFATAKRKARFGHNDWIVFRGRNGADVCERWSASAVKRAMLAVGTQGRFHLIAASTGVGHIYRWRMGVTVLRNASVAA